jgi:type II secretion system protein G
MLRTAVRPPYRGFTLVELLVVIVIIGILVGLLVPAVIAARERARQTQCTNNQKNIGQAIAQYELTKRQFPGYVNQMAWKVNTGSTSNFDGVGWPVVILQELDRADLWDAMRSAKTPADVKNASTRIPLFVCPSHSRSDTAALSYVANCGQQDGDSGGLGDKANKIPPDWLANGVFHRHYYQPDPTSFINVAVAMTDIKDGTQHTLLISENLQAGEWSKTWSTNLPAKLEEEQSWGMVWWPEYDPAKNIYDTVRINADLDAEPAAASIYYARPSSYHPGGIVATFSDGHTQFLNEKMDYLVYQLIMTPDGANAKIAGDAAVPNPIPDWRKTPLDASKLQ